MEKIAVAGLMLLLLIAGGKPAHAESLAQALEGKTGEDRRETLHLACLNEAEWSTKERNKKVWFREHNVAAHQPPTEETARLKNLCRDMHDLHVGDAGEFEKRAALARECRQEIDAGIKKDNALANVQHFEKMRQICEETLGQNIMINSGFN